MKRRIYGLEKSMESMIQFQSEPFDMMKQDLVD